MSLLIGLGILIVIVFMAISYYNGFVKLSERVKNAFGQIDVILQQRYDMIPNLVEVVKGYAKHEKETLESVINARNKGLGATPEEKLKNSGELSSALSRLLVLTENYPELKANTNFLKLQDELKDIETKIKYARQSYNDVVTMYNQKIKMFPGVLFAKIFGYTEKEVFKVEEEGKKAPKIQF